MTHFAPTRYAFVLLASLAFAGVVGGCSESNFAGGSKSGDGFGLGSGGGKGNDGDETDCDPARDPDCTSSGGTGTGTAGVTPGDANGDGIPDAQQGLGTGDSNGDGIPDNLQTGGDEGDLNNDGIPDSQQPGLGGGDGTQTQSLLEDGVITYTHHDEDHTLSITRLKNAMPDGLASTHQVGEDTQTLTLTKMCNTYKPTCFEIKVNGNVEQKLGRDSCIAVESQDANSMTINVDADGKALIGSCLSGSGSDERFIISCPHGIEPQGCTG
jgi:hypothetical protein